MSSHSGTPSAEQQFAADTANFKVTVLHEHGAYRHLRFGEPGRRWGSTDIHTWPGGVATSGDMADGFLFERGIEFFAGRPNLNYWAEKLTRAGRVHGNVKEFSGAVMRENLLSQAENYGLSEEGEAAFREDLAELADSIEAYHADAHAAYDAMEGHRFNWASADGAEDAQIQLQDMYELDVEDFTFMYRWACLALSAVATALRDGTDRVVRPAPVAPAPQPALIHECNRCGFEAPGVPGVPFRGCPRCTVTVEGAPA
ncbi:hypothetical protein [Microbacterium sp. 77mftsu3.1]|uniref:hypothetical protein n=1 Tax=Microbacterium sp. 77mftsu3.1 TaxID=1761802 RepID=UPI00036DF429|nr:hypothetical protein [Microbacterium sp. 77mftsu3.1]SDH56470.1 hypothetical protein SAMN04488590_3592 [Microbacterium sp. 77mftsu3.1]